MALKIIFGILLLIAYIVMMTIMIIFERDKPKYIVCWSILFLLTQLVGYVIYLTVRSVYYKKRNSLTVKLKEDDIYKNLIGHHLANNQTKTDNALLNFNQLAFNAVTTKNNNYTIYTSYQKGKESLIKDIKAASKYIILELSKINSVDFEDVKTALIEKAESGVAIRFVYNKGVNLKLKKALKSAGIRLYKFSKYNTLGKVYGNLRNVIIIDGVVSYIGRIYATKQQRLQLIDSCDMLLKIKGDVVQEINLALHQDTVFASGKYLEIQQPKNNDINNEKIVQFVSNQVDNDMELLLIKAICMAKQSIQLQLSTFIPTESIMSLLKFAINSNIDVRLMVPLRAQKHFKYFASRAYAKELALCGANVYLYDGRIGFNAITVDNEYVLAGSYVIDREHLNTSLQNILVINDENAVQQCNDMFDKAIKNSYRINDAKLMLVREKFFKNFV